MKRQPFRPMLEWLEGRLAPASAVLSGTTLTITGTAAANTATITDNGSQVVVNCDNIQNRSFNNVTAVVINLGGGNDKLTYTAPDNALNSLTRSVVARLGTAASGAGNVATFSFGNLGAGAAPATLALSILGDVGEDRVTVNFAGITNGTKVNLNESLSSGSDPSGINYNGGISGTGTEVFTNVNLGPGNNQFTTVFGSGNFFMPNNSRQALSQTVIGSSRAIDRDNVRAFVNGRVDARLSYNVRLNAGNDAASVGINYNVGIGVASFGGRLQVAVDGGAGNDIIVVNHNRPDGTESAGGNSVYVFSGGTLFDLALNGGAGNDNIMVDFDNGGFQIDAAAVFRIRVNGDNGIDDPAVAGLDAIVVTVVASPSSNSSSGATVDIAVRGDDGDDLLALTFTNNATAAFVSLYTEIDGGNGNDFSSGNPVVQSRCEA